MGDAVAVRGDALDEQEELARDERFVLCRAHRAADGVSVLLKRTLDNAASPADAAALEREFELLRSLPIEAITRSLELLAGAGRCTLVLEDHGGKTLAALTRESRLPLGWVLDYATQLAALLAE